MRWVDRLEPMWWALFSAGGMVAALLIPVHIFLNNVAVPLGWISANATAYTAMSRMVGNPLVKVYLVVLLVPTLFHVAHRLGFLPQEFQVPISRHSVGPMAYLLAGALAIASIVIVVLAP